ncbi:unnamed protein product, partial [Ectocarpus sp. 6 AP-2014]
MRRGIILKTSRTSPPFTAPLFIRVSQTTAGRTGVHSQAGHSVTVQSTNSHTDTQTKKRANYVVHGVCTLPKHQGSPQVPRPNLQAQQQSRVAILFTTPIDGQIAQDPNTLSRTPTLRTNSRYWRQEHNKEDSIDQRLTTTQTRVLGGTLNHPRPPPRHNERYRQPL